MAASLSRQPAGLVRRLAALLYDSLLLAASMFAFTLIVILIRGGAAIANSGRQRQTPATNKQINRLYIENLCQVNYFDRDN